MQLLQPRTPKQQLPRPRELMQLIFATMRLKRSTQKLRYAQSSVGIFLFKDGQKLVYCKGCKGDYSYAGWADHCAKQHPQHSKVNGEAHADDGDKDDDGVSRSKLQSKAKAAAKKKPQPKAKAAAKKTGCLKKGP